MLEITKCCLIVVDVQGKLAQLMYQKDELFKNISILINAAKILDIPLIWCQQCPESLGQTVPEIAELLSGIEPVNKSTFSCGGDKQFIDKLREIGRNQIILCGIESHICVYQTAVDLLRTGCDIALAADAVSSRTLDNKQYALEKMKTEGVNIYSVEMLLFELLKTAEHPHFKEIAKLIK